VRTHASRPIEGKAERAKLWRAGGVLTLGVVLAACQLVGADASARPTATAQDVVAVAGWTRIATTEKYLVVANVLPGENMFTQAENAAKHPTFGELCVIGVGAPVGPNVRHVEAHIYDRKTGLPLTDITPSIVVLDRGSGKRTIVPPTLMQDLNIGALDIHFGNNVVVAGNTDVKLTVTIGDEEVTFDGHIA
jgi:hypothetical protein